MGGSITLIVKDSGQIEHTLPIKVSVLPNWPSPPPLWHFLKRNILQINTPRDSCVLLTTTGYQTNKHFPPSTTILHNIIHPTPTPPLRAPAYRVDNGEENNNRTTGDDPAPPTVRQPRWLGEGEDKDDASPPPLPPPPDPQPPSQATVRWVKTGSRKAGDDGKK